MGIRAILLRTRMRACVWAAVGAVLLTMAQTSRAYIRFEPAGAGGIGGVLAVTSGTNTTWLHADGMGNVVLATDGAGNQVAEYEYTPFGEEIARSGSFDSRFRFSSKERDPETGFYDFGYRVYAPFLGRWLSRDPLGEFADPLHNLYRFVGNNPLNMVDPDGLWAGWASGEPIRGRIRGRSYKIIND